MNVIFMLIAAFLFSACGAEEVKESSFDTVVDVRKVEGWSLHEILGEKGEGSYSAFALSETARAVRAFWVESGERKSKQYQQDEWIYLVLIFQKPDGDSYAAVMRKPR